MEKEAAAPAVNSAPLGVTPEKSGEEESMKELKKQGSAGDHTDFEGYQKVLNDLDTSHIVVQKRKGKKKLRAVAS